MPHPRVALTNRLLHWSCDHATTRSGAAVRCGLHSRICEDRPGRPINCFLDGVIENKNYVQGS
jgi:hypothetical protein